MFIDLIVYNVEVSLLRFHELLQTREALLNECPKLSAATFPPVTMTIEDLIRARGTQGMWFVLSWLIEHRILFLSVKHTLKHVHNSKL